MRILCVEDDPIIRQFIVMKCKKFGKVRDCEDHLQAADLIKACQFDYAIVDLNLKDEESLNGLEIIDLCRQYNISSAVLTGHEDPKIIEQAFNAGAGQYFSKVELSDNLDYLLHSFLKPVNEISTRSLFKKKYITRHEPLISAIELAVEQSRFQKQNILITGPTGVGKTKVAEIIHEFSHNKGPFIAKNLNEINENLLESELFGHVKGAFTGANQNKTGLLEKADGGMLFLDEIASLPLSIQQKLLKVIEEKTFSPVGSQEIKKVNFQLITATCENIPEKIERGELRIDFYFRIRGTELNIPALKDRAHDISPLIDHIIGASPKKIFISQEIMSIFNNYEWPGNIRELIDTIKHILIKSTGMVTREDLPQYIYGKNNCEIYPQATSFITPANLSYLKENGLPGLIKQIEMEAFCKARELYGDRINKIARELKISKSVYYRMAQDFERNTLCQISPTN